MYLIGVETDAPSQLIDGLREEMTRRGDVAVVERDTGCANSTAIRASYDPNGGWETTIPEESIRSLLDEMAARCDFVIVEALSDERWNTLSVENGILVGDVLSEPTALEELSWPDLVDRIEETEPWESLESLIARVKASSESDRAGAIATFTGRVRARETTDDTPTEYLEFEAYGDVAQQRLDKITAEIREREGVYEVAMHHRTGVIVDGEDIVFVVILAGHREEAFEAVEDGINRLKAEVPIFKKEVTVDEEYWVHTRP